MKNDDDIPVGGGPIIGFLVVAIALVFMFLL
jgi:hypothetical protein